MSGSSPPPPPLPVWLPPMRAGETDGRYLNCTPDLGPFGDSFPSLSVLTLTIARQDSRALSAADLQSAGSAWPDTLDSTGLIPTFGLTAPSGAAGVTYQLTLTANTTVQGRLFIRDMYIEIASIMG